MKCKKCNSDVLKSFFFCHNCGNVLDEDLPKKVECNVPQPQPTTRLLSFNEFQKRKSNERAQHVVKKKQQIPPKEVLIGVGIMTLSKGELKPIKGKVKMVRVPATIRKLDLLRVSYEKHCAHDRKFDKEALYTLVYPNGTEVLTLPDDPNCIFQLEEYQKDVGKPFNHITLFLLKRSEQELYNQLQQDSGNDTDGNSGPLEDNNTRQISGIESLARAGSCRQTSAPSQLIVQSTNRTSPVTQLDLAVVDDHRNDQNNNESKGNCFDVQVVNTLASEATRSSRGIQSLKEMFPTKSENESLEEAINLLVEVQETSVNDLYGPLLSGECEDDVNIYHDEDELLHQSRTLYTVNDKVTEKIQNWKELNMDSSGNFRMKVRRQNVWEDYLTKLGKAKEDVYKPIKV